MRRAGCLALSILLLQVLPGVGIAQQPTTSSPAGPDDSAIIGRLKQQLPANPTMAAKRFWEGVARTGTPLIEPVAASKGYSFVTFIWRGDDKTRNVVIFDGVAGFDAKDRMARVAGTDVWYKTYRVRNDARFTYNLSPNDSLQSFDEIKGDEAMKKRLAAFRADPLNPRHCPTTFGAYGTDSSYVELPSAGPLLWESSMKGVAPGKLIETTVHSDILRRDKKLWVYTPAGFSQRHAPYPLLVLFDGDRNSMWMPKILDLMIARRQIPPIIAVMTDESTPSIRNSELPCNPEFADFLAKELVPWARSNYSATISPQRTIVAGSSYGGLASVYAGLRHPEIFGNVISLSGSFFWKPQGSSETEWLVQQMAHSPTRALRFYLEVGLMEVGAVGIDQIGSNRRMHQTLLARGYPTGYAEYDGGHSFLNWSQGMVHGLGYLMR
jgi:enterochelin esterase-like enzyme